jgi:hypothetical protein
MKSIAGGAGTDWAAGLFYSDHPEFRPAGTAPKRVLHAASAVALLSLLAACTEPVSWQKLLSAKISQQYPGYTVQPATGGNLTVLRPGLTAVAVDVNDIAAYCLRGPRDCDYVTDKMLLSLAPK